jgi:hypothetical protein
VTLWYSVLEFCDLSDKDSEPSVVG